jgi:TolA-binding protein
LYEKPGIHSGTAAKNAALQDAGANRQALSKNIETERSDYLMACSPFMVLFWVATLATLLYVCLTPLGMSRLGACLAFAGIMAIMLVITLVALATNNARNSGRRSRATPSNGKVNSLQDLRPGPLVVGTPLERRVERAVHEAIRADPDSALMMMATITSGKTVWFWLALVSVLLVAATEAVSNLLWKSFELVRPVALGGIAAGALVLAVAGVGTQAVLWQTGLTAMESRLAQLNQVEEEKARKADEAERSRREAQGLMEERRQAELRKQREDYDARQKDLEQERERQRLEAERLRLEKERKDQERREEEAREAKELAKRQAEEAEHRRQEAAIKEAALKKEEEEASQQYKAAERLHKEGKVEEAITKLDKIIQEHSKVPSAEQAASLKRAIEQEIKRNEKPASNAWLYARRLYLDGNLTEAHKRLKEVQNKYPGTGGAR